MLRTNNQDETFRFWTFQAVTLHARYHRACEIAIELENLRVG